MVTLTLSRPRCVEGNQKDNSPHGHDYSGVNYQMVVSDNCVSFVFALVFFFYPFLC